MILPDILNLLNVAVSHILECHCVPAEMGMVSTVKIGASKIVFFVVICFGVILEAFILRLIFCFKLGII